MRKFPAFGKTVLIHGAHLTGKKMARYSAHYHLPLLAFLDIFFPEYFFCDTQAYRNIFGFGRRNIYHQHFATGATLRTIYPGGNGFIQTKYLFVNCFAIFIAKEYAERIIFLFPRSGEYFDRVPICFKCSDN
jgi:hypothetical protein